MITGKRTKSNTMKLINDYAIRTNFVIPKLITSDHYKPYSEAILQTYGLSKEIDRPNNKRGRKPIPKKVLPENLLYVIIEKKRKNGKVIDIKNYVKYGDETRLQDILDKSPVSNHINNVFVERYNATDRQMSSRKKRKCYTFSKEFDYHEPVGWFIVTYYNFCRYNNGLTKRLSEEEIINSKRKYYYQTPAMASGIAEYKWSIWELLNIRY